MMKLEIEKVSKEQNIDVQRERIESEEVREGARIGAKIAEGNDKNKKDAILEGTKIGIQLGKEM
jgi:hypothetical protein